MRSHADASPTDGIFGKVLVKHVSGQHANASTQTVIKLTAMNASLIGCFRKPTSLRNVPNAWHTTWRDSKLKLETAPVSVESSGWAHVGGVDQARNSPAKHGAKTDCCHGRQGTSRVNVSCGYLE